MEKLKNPYLVTLLKMGRDFQIRHKYKHNRLCYQSELHFDSSFIPLPLLIRYVKQENMCTYTKKYNKIVVLHAFVFICFSTSECAKHSNSHPGFSFRVIPTQQQNYLYLVYVSDLLLQLHCAPGLNISIH